MAITRIFRVEIDPELRDEFEEKFATISVHVAESAVGSVSVTILKPTVWAPNEYCMVSTWESEESLREFAGENWYQAVIPAGMEQYVVECSVHHYDSWSR